MGTNLLTIEELLNATNGTLFNTDFEKNESVLGKFFTSVAIDSRNSTDNSLFIPLMGEKQDGHNYVEQAVTNGATIILVQKSSLGEFSNLYEKLGCKAVFIIVENTLTALQNSATFYVKKFPHLKRIAITGSNGKTTTKECVANVLKQKFNVVMTQGNLNSETGLPLSMFTIREEHEVGVFEMGMNRVGEITELANVFFPELAIITNIGTAHIGILGTKDNIAEQKKQIFSNFTKNCTGFIFEDELYFDFLQKDVPGTIIPYGKKSIKGISNITDAGILGSVIRYKNTDINFPLIGAHNVNNACAAIIIAEKLGLSEFQIQAGLESITPLFGRAQILRGEPTIIQDCYNGSFESMSASLDFFENVKWNAKKIVVLGDMLELGEKSLLLHKEILEKVFSQNFDVVVCIGEAFSTVLKEFDTSSCIVKSTKTIDDNSVFTVIESLRDIVFSSDIILIKASRGIALERTVSIFNGFFIKGAENE